jgi:hypothetical protein
MTMYSVQTQEVMMSQLSREFGDICISCTVLPVLGITLVSAVVYYLLSLFF